MTSTTSPFDLPERLSAKAAPELIQSDERHFAAIVTSLERSIGELETRLDAERKAPGGHGQSALDRDLEVHRLAARLRAIRRYGIDLVLGRMVLADDSEPVYVGRFGLADADGRRLVVDWRSPVAEPFFASTHATPMGLVSRRRYRWNLSRVTDFWDEVFAGDVLENAAALDDQSAFIASLGSTRSPRMRDVLGTIQADQDAIIRAGSRGALVVDGGPGTGKTVVALHRTAYLLYSEPRLAGGGGVLFVGPHEPYLAYVEDVLPSLGEESVRTCTVRDLVEEGSSARAEQPGVAALKASLRLLDAVETAVRYYEDPPTAGMLVETPWGDVRLTAAEWAFAFDAAEPGVSHNESRTRIWEELLDIIAEKFDDEEVPAHLLRRSLSQNDELTRAFGRAWPLLDPAGVVADLWSEPAYLRYCAPWLSTDDVQLLQRGEPRAWTTSDLPFLDAARARIGDPKASRRNRRREAEIAAQKNEMQRVVDDLIAADDSDLKLMSMLRGQDAQNSLVDDAALPALDADSLAGPFAHIVVDEAQELTDAEWQMLVRRCPSRSFTIVGDRAQARHGFHESWQQRLTRVGLDDITMASLTINYRTPSEVMDVAEPVIRAALPDANVPTSIRSSGCAVLHRSAADLDAVLGEWLASHELGTACVIGATAFVGTSRVRSLTPSTAKGLEFDLVVLVDPELFGGGIEGAVDRYVAMTRATQQLVILYGPSNSSGGANLNRQS